MRKLKSIEKGNKLKQEISPRTYLLCHFINDN